MLTRAVGYAERVMPLASKGRPVTLVAAILLARNSTGADCLACELSVHVAVSGCSKGLLRWWDVTATLGPLPKI